MIELKYPCEIFNTPITYTITQQYPNSVYYIYHNTTAIGSIKKLNDTWEQIGGREMGETLTLNIGTFIDNSLSNGRI